MKKQILFLSMLASALAFSSCEEDEPAPAPPTTEGVFIGNEGAFTNGTGSLSIYNPAVKEVNNNIYQKANTAPMGNTLNHVLVDGDEIFLVLNGAGEVHIIDAETYKLKSRIQGLNSPRQIVKVSDNKFYITDWLEEGVRVYNRNAGALTKSIFTGQGPEQMLVYEDMVFVANSGGVSTDSTLTVIDAQADTVMRQIYVGHNPNSMQIGADTSLWVLSSGIADFGNPFNSTAGSLVSIPLGYDSLFYNIDTLAVEDSLVFVDNQQKPVRLTANEDGSLMYFLDNVAGADLYRFDIENPTLPIAPFIMGNFYGLGYDVIKTEIYLSDAKDFQTNGDVMRYDEDGEQLDIFKTGIIPSSFGFK